MMTTLEIVCNKNLQLTYNCNKIKITRTVISEKMSKGQLEIKNYKYVWKFEDFLKHSRDSKQTYMSPIFQVGNFENSVEQTKWVILMYPFGNSGDPKHMDFGVVKLDKSDKSECTVSNNCHIKLGLINNAGQEVYVRSTDVEKGNNPDWKISDFISKDELMENKDTLLVNGTLSIVLEVNFNSDSDEKLNTKAAMINDFEAMFLSGRFSDLTIMIGHYTIKAHKNILASRSKVFSAMFDRDEDRNNNKVVKIDDVSYNVMKELLRFMYSGKICNKNINFVKSLLIAADKYNVDSLKDMCENILCENLSIKNVSDFLVVSDSHNCERLKAVIMVYMIKNFKYIKSVLSFKKLEDLYPELAQEVLRRNADSKVKITFCN